MSLLPRCVCPLEGSTPWERNEERWGKGHWQWGRKNETLIYIEKGLSLLGKKVNTSLKLRDMAKGGTQSPIRCCGKEGSKNGPFGEGRNKLGCGEEWDGGANQRKDEKT